jgi:probable F420-dependent oxidoreductase
VRFGYALPNNWGVEDPRELLALAKQAEDTGFSSLWVQHHILNVGYVGERLGLKPYWDALTMLGWIAAETERVRLGTSVLVLPYLHLMVLAKQLATLDVLSGGRIDLGIGVGIMPEENEALGIDYHTRGAYADESIEVLKALWAEGAASYSGRFFSFQDVPASPKPLQRPHPPLLIGGTSGAALRRVARHGDGWHPLLLSIEQLERRLARLDEELATAGRTRKDVTVCMRLHLEEVPSREDVDRYAELGVDEVLLALESGDVDRHRQLIDEAASALL